MTLEALRSISQEDLRRALLGALAHLRANENQPRLIPYYLLLAQAGVVLGRPELFQALKSAQLSFLGGVNSGKQADEHYDNAVFLSAVWSLVADGTIIPRLVVGAHALNIGKPFVEIEYVSVTPMGDALVRALPDHPRFPGGLDRLVVRHPMLKEEIAPRLDDAARCVDRNLPRPAIVMTGLAMETALANAEEVLTKANKWPGQANTRIQAAERIRTMNRAIEQHYQKDSKHRLIIAMSIAEQVRVKRNLAAHNPAEAFTLEEADRLLFAAAGEIGTIYDEIVNPKP